MKKYYIIFILIIFTIICCSEENKNQLIIKEKISKDNYKVFNQINSSMYSILILINSSEKILFLAKDKDNVIVDFKESDTDYIPFEPAYFDNGIYILLVIDEILYIFDNDHEYFRVIDAVYSAAVYIDGNYIYNESAAPGIRGSKYDLLTLELVNEYKGFGSLKMEELLEKYANGSGYLNQASVFEKERILKENQELFRN